MIYAFSRMVVLRSILPRITSWDIGTGRQLYSIQINDLLALPFFYDDSILFYSPFYSLKAFDRITGEERWTLNFGSDENPVLAYFSPDNRLAVGSAVNSPVVMFPVVENAQPTTLNTIRGGLPSLAWRPDSSAIAFTDEANMLYIWAL
jgi:hypothetical protein